MASCNIGYQSGYSFCKILFASALPRGLRMRMVKRPFNVCIGRLEQSRTRDVSWLVQCMASMYTALGSVSRTTETSGCSPWPLVIPHMSVGMTMQCLSFYS